MRRVKKQVAASSSSNPPSARKTPSMSSKKKKEEENWRSMVDDSQQETIVLSSSRETAGMEKVSTKLARIIANEASAVTISKTPDDHHFDFEDEESESEEADGLNISFTGDAVHNSDNSEDNDEGNNGNYNDELIGLIDEYDDSELEEVANMKLCLADKIDKNAPIVNETQEVLKALEEGNMNSKSQTAKVVANIVTLLATDVCGAIVNDEQGKTLKEHEKWLLAARNIEEWLRNRSLSTEWSQQFFQFLPDRKLPTSVLVELNKLRVEDGNPFQPYSLPNPITFEA